MDTNYKYFLTGIAAVLLVISMLVSYNLYIDMKHRQLYEQCMKQDMSPRAGRFGVQCTTF